MRRLILLLAVVIVLNLNIISAEIMFSQPKPVYSIGDFLEITSTLKANDAANGFFILSLNCDGTDREFYLSPASLTSGQQETASKKLLLSRTFLRDMLGNCRVNGKFESESASSEIFQITDKIDLSVSVSPVVANPGRQVSIKGAAIKANSQNLEGFAEISADSLNIAITVPVNQGKFQANFSVPDNAKSGNYDASVKVYDKSGNEIGNNDERILAFVVKQEPRKIEIIADKQNIKPGESILLKTQIYDQAGDKIKGDVKVEMKDPAGNNYIEKTLQTEEEFQADFDISSSPGYWTIYAYSFGLNDSRYVIIEEFENAKFNLFNGTLTIVNAGNVAYKKTIDVKIGADLQSFEISLEIGESKKFKISAPDGQYNVQISDGAIESEFKNVLLTGSAISIEDIQGINIFKKYPVVWLFLIIIFGLFAVLTTGRFTRRKFYGNVSSAPPISARSASRQEEKEYKEVKSGEKGFSLIKEAKQAEHSHVLSGRREQASIIAVKIKNPEVMRNKIVKENFDKINEMINRHRGSLYPSQEGTMGIFAPSNTKSFKNDSTAVKIASEIAAHLNQHNLKFKEKIEFGIGIHSGEIASSIEGEKLKFASLGNIMNIARKMSAAAKNNVLLSKEVNSKVSGEVKTEKAGEYYSIRRIVDRELHKDFLNNFLKRN